jgi:hypothetical protein
LSGLDLGHWQDSMMKQSLNGLQCQIREEPGQPVFFSRPQRPRRSQDVTYEQRQIDADRPYESTRGDRSTRARRNSNIPDANREPHVSRVTQSSSL